MKRLILFSAFVVITSGLGSNSIWAAQEVPQTFTFDGRAFSNAEATAPMLDSISMRIQILNSVQDCILYEETQTINTTSSNGYFTIQVGSVTSNAKRSANDSNHSMSTVFSNISMIPGKLLSNGSACSYTPAAGDKRYVRIQMTPSGDGVTRTISPNVALDSVPNSLVAERAESLQGLSPSSLLQVNTTGSNVLSQSNLENIFSNTGYSRLNSLLSVPPANYVQTGSNGSATLPSVSGNPSSGLTAGQIWYDSGSNVMKYFDGSVKTFGTSAASGTVTSIATGTGLTGGPITTTGTISVDVGTTTGKIVQVAASNKLPVIDGSNLTNVLAAGLSGPVSTQNIDVWDSSSAHKISITAPAPASLPANYSLTLPGALPASNGQLLSSTTAGVLSWVSPGGSGTVNSGTANQLAMYSATGNTVSGLTSANNGVLVTSAGGVPSISSALPSAVQGNISSVGTISSGTWNGTAVAPQYGGTGVNGGAAANGTLLVGNGAGYTLANITQSANQGVTITNGAGTLSLGTVQDIRTSASPTFAGVLLNNVATNLTQSVSVGTSYSITWPGNVATVDGAFLSSTTGGLLSWSTTLPSANGGTGHSSYAVGDLLYASTTTALSRLPASTSGYVLKSNGAGVAPSWGPPTGASFSGLTAASAINTLDNTNYAQTWNWSSANTQTAMSISANSLTSGTGLSLSSSSASLNSTNGLLNVANSGASTNGMLARFQSSSAAGSGMTILTSGNVGINTVVPRGGLDVNSTILGKPAVVNATGTVDFSSGNIQYTASNCGAFQLNNLKDGGSYTFIVQGTTSATCAFTAFSDAGVTALTVRMPPDHTATIASKHTIYSILVGGSHVYVAWTPGY